MLHMLALLCRYVPMFGDLDYDPTYAYQAGTHNAEQPVQQL